MLNSQTNKKFLYLGLRVQRFLGWLFFPLLSSLLIVVMKYYARYHIYNIEEVREKYREICSLRKNSPLLICPNHLTMIDSVIIEWALGGPLWYWLNFKHFAWNIPAVENFKTNLISRIITYLGKCIPIDRRGSKEHIELVMSKVKFLLSEGDAFLIFPEGTRSRTGRFELENITYGIGKIIQELENVHILCIYLRGDNQITYSNFPQKKEKFRIDMELIVPKTQYTGIRGQKDLALQVGKVLKKLEDEYMSNFKADYVVGK